MNSLGIKPTNFFASVAASLITFSIIFTLLNILS